MADGIESYGVTAAVAPELTESERDELTRFMRMVGRAVGDLEWAPDPSWRFSVEHRGTRLRVVLRGGRSGRVQGTYVRWSDGTWMNEENGFQGRP